MLRAVFRACYARFRYCIFRERNVSRATLEQTHMGGRRITWGRKDEEYLADFYLVSRRSLGHMEWRVFCYHYLLGADWKLCAKRLGLDRGTFFHVVYRLQHRLGRVFKELQPYALFPIDEYFQGRTHNTAEEGGPIKVVPFRKGSLSRRLQVPIRKAA
ncbi:MAG: hypothetical protein HZB13_13430 [Acidobacteria bacterium]|nr:hypothetical protein [Acidobacteriota bacterium]